MDAKRIDELRAQAHYSRQRHDLYRAKSFGSRPTSVERLRELEREAQLAEERLTRALASPD